MFFFVFLLHIYKFACKIQFFATCIPLIPRLKCNSNRVFFLSQWSPERTDSVNAATDAWGVGRECVVETQSPHIGCPLPPERNQETRGAAVLNNGPAPHQPGLKRPHSVPWLS